MRESEPDKQQDMWRGVEAHRVLEVDLAAHPVQNPHALRVAARHRIGHQRRAQLCTQHIRPALSVRPGAGQDNALDARQCGVEWETYPATRLCLRHLLGREAEVYLLLNGTGELIGVALACSPRHLPQVERRASRRTH